MHGAEVTEGDRKGGLEAMAAAIALFCRFAPRLSTHLKWVTNRMEAANTEIWIPIVSLNGHFACRIEFSGSKGRAYPCITASNDEDVGHKILL
jgi:hypothetical protein